MKLKFFVKLSKSAVESHRMLCETYSNEALSEMITYE
jgi:hypothetical protein